MEKKKIPSQSFEFFNTATSLKENLSSNEIEVEVESEGFFQKEEEEKKEKPLEKKAFSEKDKKKNILQRAKEISLALGSGKSRKIFSNKSLVSFELFLFLAFFPALILIIFFMLSYFRKIYGPKYALKKALKKLDDLKNSGQAEKLFTVLIGYFSQRLGLRKNQITENFISSKLKNLGFSQEEVEKFLQLFDLLMSFSFSQERDFLLKRESDILNLADELKKWLKLIDSKIEEKERVKNG